MIHADALSLAPHVDPEPDELTPHGALAALAPNAAEHTRALTPEAIARTTAAYGPVVTADALGLTPHAGPSPEQRCPTLAALSREVSR